MVPTAWGHLRRPSHRAEVVGGQKTCLGGLTGIHRARILFDRNSDSEMRFFLATPSMVVFLVGFP